MSPRALDPPDAMPAANVWRPRRLTMGALLVASGGLAGLVIGVLLEPARTLHAYLAAFAWAFSIAAGALFMVMIGHVTNARWFVAVRRLGESVAATLPVFALLFVPIAFGVATLYPWVPPLPELPQPLAENIARKDAWLNVPFWLARSLIYFIAFSFVALRLRDWSLRQDRGRESAPAERPIRLAAVGILTLGFLFTLAAWDWLMSLRPDWVSTVFGAYWWAGGFLAGLASMVVLARGFERSGALGEAVGAGHYYALGRLMLTFTAFWAYLAFSQGFLIWIADLPREAQWYIHRWRGGWSIVLWALIIGHFAVPFFALLSRRLKRDGRRLLWVAAWLLLMHYVDMFWLVIPALADARPAWHWQDVASLALVTGATVAFGAWRMNGHTVVAVRDPRLEESMQYRRS